MNEKKKKEPGQINRRRCLTLEKKLDIIKSHESGKTYAKIARENGMNESSIRSILRKKEQYKELAGSTASYLSKVVIRQRSSLLSSMERLLIAWIEDCNQKRIQLTDNEIQRKALSLFDELKASEGDGDTKEKFAASRGWFYRFKNRVNLRNCIISGGKPTTDKDAAVRFCTEFREIVREGGYTHKQIFNVDETILYWKKMPTQTFLAESEKNIQGFKPSKDTLTLLLGANATGDFKLKPLVVFRAETPSALRDCEKSSLPVIWRSNRKAWLTQEILLDWLNNYFHPAAEAYCSHHGIEFKILLLLDSAPNHEVAYSNENIKLVFLHPNTAPLIQPMSQGIFPNLKGCYLRQILSQAIEASTGPDCTPIQEFWKVYNIKNAVINIAASWNEISSGDLVSVWHQILPVVKPDGLENQIEMVAHDIVTMGKYFGFQTLDIPNVQNCIDSTFYEMDEESVEIEQPVICKTEAPDVDEVEFLEYETELPDIHDLEKILESVDTACETILATDSDIERSIKARQALQNGIQCYRDLYFERKRKRN